MIPLKIRRKYISFTPLWKLLLQQNSSYRSKKRIIITYRSPFVSHRCSWSNLHRRNRSKTLDRWDLRSPHPPHACDPSCPVDQASSTCRQTAGGDQTSHVEFWVSERTLWRINNNQRHWFLFVAVVLSFSTELYSNVFIGWPWRSAPAGVKK